MNTKAIKTFPKDFTPYTLTDAERLAQQRNQAAEDRRRERTKTKLDQTLAALEQAQARRRQA